MSVAASNSARPASAGEAEARRRQLRRILDSSDFDATDRDRRFLAHVVEESLCGRADRIKAYTIALEVFGRDPSFDPQTDPIVRVEAGHLRRALDRYYLSAGRADPIVITIPKGGYAPVFTPRAAGAEPEPAPAPAEPARRSRRRWLPLIAAPLVLGLGVLLGVGLDRGRALLETDDAGIPRLEITGFDAVASEGPAAAAAAGLTSELIAEVSRFKDIVVVAGPGEGADHARYRLTGDLALDGGALRAQARLLRLSDGAVIWAQTYPADLAVERPLSAESRIAGEIATAIGQPYGAIFQADAARRAADATPPDDAYGCTLAYFTFRATIDPASYARARDCLEDATRRFPDNATAWGLLAQIHLDGQRWGFGAPTTLDQTVGEARHALMLDPLNVRALQAKMLVLYFSGDHAGAIHVGDVARAINPNDTELLGEYGFRLALSGRWDEGCPMLREATDRNPGPLPYYEVGLALCAYIAGDYADAAHLVRGSRFEAPPIYHVVAAAILAEAGDVEGAHRERDWITVNAPQYPGKLRATLRERAGRPEDIERFIGSLRKAGIVVPDETPGGG